LRATIRIIAEILDMDADDLLKKVLTNLKAEQFILNRFSENSLKRRVDENGNNMLLKY